MKTFWKKLYTIGDLEVVGNGSRFLDLETDLGLGEPCPLLSLLQLLLGLPELGQVEGGDLLGLFDLLLVGLDLGLQLVGKVAHPVLVLLVLLNLEGKLLGTALRLLVALGVLVGVSKLLLQLGQLGLEGTLSLALGVGVVLLGAELIRQTRSIHHSLLGLLLGVLGLLKHVVDLCVHGMDGALDGPLVAGSPELMEVISLTAARDSESSASV